MWHGCLCALFCVCVVLCVGSVLRRADPPLQESYRLCKKDQETEKATKVQKGL
jgi:hypothetical protein